MTTFDFPVQRSIRLNNNIIEPIWPEHILKRSQDLEEAYHDAGQWYWYRLIDGKLNQGHLERAFIELSPLLVQDIDTLDDWRIAEIKYAFNKSGKIWHK